MGLIIQDGTGKGFQAKVFDDGSIRTAGAIYHIQHNTSRFNGQAYQSLATLTLAASGTHICQHFKVTDSTRFMAINYIRLQGVGFTGLPDENTYIEIGKDQKYSSGGSAITPVNMNFRSGNGAEVSVYSEPTVTETLTPFEKWYVQPDAAEERFEKWGSIILGQNDELTIRLVTDKSTGYVKTRVSFVMIENDT